MRRVALTGIGLVTPLGVGVDENWGALVAGKSGVGQITRFDASRFATRIAAEVKDFDPSRWLAPREARRLDRFIQFAVAAGRLAFEDAGLPARLDDAAGDRAGCYVGSGMGGLITLAQTHDSLAEKGPRHGISPYFVPGLIINMGAGELSIRHNLRGPSLAHVSACATGAHAIGEAARAIQHGTVDLMVAGGAEAAITALGVGGFNAARSLATAWNDQPARASRPFDRDRDGFVIAEGAGIVILEDLEAARRRGARIHAELVGYGASSDAHHITQPPPGGEGAVRCMRAALADARVAPTEVSYVNAHGTSTVQNDAVETEALKTVFADHARALPISSTKSMTGHLLGAAGAVEAAFTALAIARQVVPPTINLDTPDPACDLDYVPHIARDARLRFALSNSFGFGGTNATLVFGSLGG
jgi:3-oxoacyl-[acyl-carrier-protein] synthase II